MRFAGAFSFSGAARLAIASAFADADCAGVAGRFVLVSDRQWFRLFPKGVEQYAQTVRQLGMPDVDRSHLIARHAQRYECALPVEERELVRQFSTVDAHFVAVSHP